MIYFSIFCLSFTRESGVEETQAQTHSDFDDFTVEAVDRDDDVAGIRRRIGSIVPGKSSIQEH